MTFDPERNNLAKTASPYLQQHADNPVWWQPWTPEVLEYAQSHDKPLFVSVGYATCHWCHVMAAEAFSHTAVAEQLNRDFVSIKIDREERPELDHYLMQFLMASQGQGGWPLNAFLTPDGRPFLALTYLPVEPRPGRPGFRSVLDQVTAYYRDNAAGVPVFDFWGLDSNAADTTAQPDPLPRQAVHRAHNLVRRTDPDYGGFGTGTKFPPHSSFVFLLHILDLYGDEVVERSVRHSLNAIARRGLHDHLQGGFYRYCVDRQWTVPHFEKMLYDQGMMLWVYSLAGHVLDDPWYKEVARGVVRCLEESFTDSSGLFVSAHDADTGHHEGLTYLWSDHDLEQLSPDDRRIVEDVFEIRPGGNFEGQHHLVRSADGILPPAARDTLEALLHQRRARQQPAIDGKIVTAWNALAAIGLVQGGRYLNRPELIERAGEIYSALVRVNRLDNGLWARSSLAGRLNPVECLEDYGALLLLTTLLAEHADSEQSFSRWVQDIEALEHRITAFETDHGWRYTLSDDFAPVPADTFDSPTPSPVSLVGVARARSALLRGAPPPVSVEGARMKPEMEQDFGNIAVLINGGEFYLLETENPRPWDALPANVLQRAAGRTTWCFRGACRPGMPSAWNPPPEKL